jgi:pSer/pThr/pTyr-binding forkhead associated (FHA) protein
MITCPSCRHQEFDGELFCSECGARLWEGGAELPPTVTFNSKQLADIPKGTATITSINNLKAGQIALTISGVTQPVILEGRNEYSLGREAQEPQTVDVNLTAYGGREKGVSRRHATLRVDRRQLLLMDLGSSNGTQLNGSPLVANEPVRLESGDEIRLGKLAVRVYFNL